MCSIRLFPIWAFKWLGTPCDCGHTVPRGHLLFLAGNDTTWCSRECFALHTENAPPQAPDARMAGAR